MTADTAHIQSIIDTERQELQQMLMEEDDEVLNDIIAIVTNNKRLLHVTRNTELIGKKLKNDNRYEVESVDAMVVVVLVQF